MIRNAVIAFCCLLVALCAHGAQYDNLLEKGEFFLEKGPAYAPDAVRALEQAREEDSERAAADVRYVAAAGLAYMRTHRYTEAYGLIEGLERRDGGDAKTEAIKDFLLNEAGVGRMVLLGAAPIEGLTGTLTPLEGVRLEVTSRKALEKLNALLSRGMRAGPDGLTLLIPEGRFLFAANRPLGAPDAMEKELEIWAGDELVQRILTQHPAPDRWGVQAGNRTIGLTWPPLEDANYQLLRIDEEGQTLTLYEGDRTGFTDNDAPLDVIVTYRLLTRSVAGELLALGEVSARARPPVQWIGAEVQIQGNLTAALSWTMDEGSIDRLRLLREDRGETEVLVDVSGEEVVRHGEVDDGPLIPGSVGRTLHYYVESWMEGEQEPSAIAAVDLHVPALAARIEAVTEEITPDRIFVEWETFPRDALAGGYAIYRVGSGGVIGELMGRVDNAHARDFSYVPKQAAPDPGWRHFVLPYLNDRYLAEPQEIEASGEKPKYRMRKRRDVEINLPDVALVWQVHAEATRYVVKVGDKELQIRDNYVELSGLQSLLKGAEHLVEILAVGEDNRRIPLLSMELRYNHYPRPETPKEGEFQ